MRNLRHICYAMVRWWVAKSRISNSALCYSSRDVERARLEGSVVTGVTILLGNRILGK